MLYRLFKYIHGGEKEKLELEPMTKWTIIGIFDDEVKYKEIWTPPDRALILETTKIFSISQENFPKN